MLQRTIHIPSKPSIARPFTRNASIASTGSLAANSALNVFDTQTKRAQRNRAAHDKEFSRVTDYLRDEVAAIMVDRLLVSPDSQKRAEMELMG